MHRGVAMFCGLHGTEASQTVAHWMPHIVTRIGMGTLTPPDHSEGVTVL